MSSMLMTGEVWDALRKKVERQEQRICELEAAMRTAAERSPLNMADAMAFSELLGDE